MVWYKGIVLVCFNCGRRFFARDEDGRPRNGAATVRRILAEGIRQYCPNCGKMLTSNSYSSNSYSEVLLRFKVAPRHLVPDGQIKNQSLNHQTKEGIMANKIRKLDAFFKLTCVACGEEKNIRYSLRLKRDHGKWVSQPVCDRCRKLLIAEAREEDKFIPFFSIRSSEKEAEKRNKKSSLRQTLIDKFAIAQAEKAKQKQKKPVKVAAEAS